MSETPTSPKNQIFYMASPFSHERASVRKWRYEAACKAAAYLIRKGLHVFSPISHTFGISKYGLPGDWSFWEKFDREFLERCEKLIVLALPGWHVSKGVLAEMRIAADLFMPIQFMDPQEAGIETKRTPILVGTGAEGGR